MQIDAAKWRLPLQCFRMYFIQALAIMVCLFFVGFVITSCFWGFGYGLAMFEFRVTFWHENEKNQGVYTY